jgi:hypothetical protein
MIDSYKIPVKIETEMSEIKRRTTFLDLFVRKKNNIQISGLKKNASFVTTETCS